MAATKTTTDNDDPITTISKDMTKHIRYLEKNVERLKKVPKPNEILEGMKNELWYKMCTLCRSTMCGLSSDNFSAWKERSNTSHPLEDQEMVEELKKDNAVFTNIIKEKDKKIKELEEKIKRTTKDEKQEAYDKIHQEKEECMKEVSQLQEERRALQDQTDSLNRTVEALSTTLKTKEENVHYLIVELEETQNELDKIQKENENNVTQISQLVTEKQKLQDEKDTRYKTNEEVTSFMEGQQKEMERLNEKLDEKQEAYDKINEEKEKCFGEVSQLPAERQTLQYQADCLNNAVEDLSSMLKAKEQSIDKLTRELEKSTQTGQYHRQETSTQTEAQREVDRKSKPSCSFTAGSSKDAMQHEQERLRSDLHRISQERDQIQKRYDYLTFELSQLDQTNSEQRNQITHLVRRLLRTSQSGLEKTMVDMVTEEITRQVGERLDPRNFDFSVVPSETSAGVSKGPLFVVCLNSMVGKNVPDALEGPKGGRDVYLLVLHQTTRENVSTLRPDSLRNNGNELQQLGGVIDMVFSSESGLVECDVNKTAVDHIATVLKKY